MMPVKEVIYSILAKAYDGGVVVNALTIEKVSFERLRFGCNAQMPFVLQGEESYISFYGPFGWIKVFCSPQEALSDVEKLTKRVETLEMCLRGKL